jgi:hypothetical protein
MDDRVFGQKSDKFLLKIFIVPIFLFQQVKKYFDELLLVMLILFLFFTATNIQSGWLYIIIATTGSVLLTGFISSVINMGKLVINREFQKINNEDDTVTVKFVLINRSRIPKFMIQIQDSFPVLYPGEEPPVLIIRYISAGGKAFVSYTRKAYKRGIYDFEPLIVRSAGILGFFSMEKKINVYDNRIIVLPSFFNLHSNILKNTPSRYFKEGRTVNMPGRSFDFSGLREYLPGMETRFIHWPSLAKRGAILLKEFRETGSCFVSVAVELHMDAKMGKGRETAEEYILKTASNFLRESDKMNFMIDLHTYQDEQLLTDHNTSLLKGLLRLSDTNADSDKTLDDHLDEIIDKTPAGSLLVILKTLAFRNPGILEKTRHKRIKTIVIFFDPFSFTPDDEISPDSSKKPDYSGQVANLRNMGISAFVYAHQKKENTAPAETGEGRKHA